MRRLITILFCAVALGSFANTNELLFAENSMMNYPDLSTCWPTILILPSGCGKTNVAVTGHDIQQGIDEIPTSVWPNLDSGCTHQVESLLEVGNSISHGSNDIVTMAGITNYVVKARTHAPNLIFAVGTAWYRRDFDSTQDQYRINVNNMIRTNWGNLPNYFVIDYDANPLLDPRVHTENFINDSIGHPNSTGAQVITNQNMAILWGLLLNGTTNTTGPHFMPLWHR